MRKTIKIQSKKADNNRQSYFVTIPEKIMKQLHILGWKSADTELVPKVEIKDNGEIALFYCENKKQ